MLVFGGVDKRSRFDDTWMYNCPTKTWTQLEAHGWRHKDERGVEQVTRPGARAHFTASKFFDRIFIFGGYGGAGVVYGDLWVLHVDMSAPDEDKLRCAVRLLHTTVYQVPL